MQRSGCVEAVSLAQPPELHVARRVDQQHPFEHLLARILEEQWDVDGDQRSRTRERGGDAFLRQLHDPRMGDPLEVAARLVIGEHDLADAATVQGAVGLDHIPSEACCHLVQGALAGTHRLAGKLVGIDDDRAMFGEHPVDGALASRDSPGHPDQSHRRGPYSLQRHDWKGDQPDAEAAHDAPDAHDASPRRNRSTPWSSTVRVQAGVALSSSVSAPLDESTAVVPLDASNCNAVGVVVAPAAMRA